MAFQGAVNATAAKAIGLWETTFAVLASGTVLTGAGLVLGLGQGGLLRLGAAPWWSLLGGPVGPVITVAVAYGIRRAGAVGATTAIIVGQIGMAARKELEGALNTNVHLDLQVRVDAKWQDSFGRR